MTSRKVMSFAARASRYPPLAPRELFASCRVTSCFRIFARKSWGTFIRRAISRKGTTRPSGWAARHTMARRPYSMRREIWRGCCMENPLENSSG
jgi:hypothetical protein